MKTSRLFFALLISLYVLCLAACQNKAAVITLNQSDAGKTVELNPGDRLVISLPGNPTTGFNWESQPAPDSSVLKQVGEAEFKADSNRVGSGGTVTLTFDAAAPGQVALTLVYHRAWETGVPPVEIYQVQVVVK